MRKKFSVLSAVAGGAAVGIYRAVKGYGVFNRLRFSDEHSSISRYLETHHPGASHSSVTDVGNGYVTIISDGRRKFQLHLTKAANDVYIFSEKEIV